MIVGTKFDVVNEENQPLHGSDKIIWGAFLDGNEEAFQVIYEGHVDALFNYGMNFLNDHFIVKEAIQDLFVNLWTTRENLGTTDNIRFYLCRSLRRRIAVHEKKERRKVSISNGASEISDFFKRKSMDSFDKEGINTTEIKTRLTKALSKLPSRQREAIYHIYFEEFSYEEVASIMNVNVKTVYNLAWRGIESLRSSMSSGDFYFTITPITIALIAEVFQESVNNNNYL